MSAKLSELISSYSHSSLHPDVEIHGLSLDSRLVKPGDLFFACKGTQLDGRKFIDQAIEKGTIAIVIESDSENIQQKSTIPIVPIKHLNSKIGEIAARFYGYPSKKLKLIGITGTNGKTSCSHFIAQSLQHRHYACGVIGTLGSGFYGDIKAGTLTTPDALSLQALFADFVSKKASAVAMEVSSHSIEQGRINGIDFEVGVFTNLTRDHLDYHGTMEAYGAAKRKLFHHALTKYAVINADDAFGNEMIATLQRKNIYAYSINKHLSLTIPTIYAENIQLDLSGIRAHIKSPWGEGELQTPLIGQFNLSNILAALTTLCLLEIEFKTALDSFKHVSPVPGRMQAMGGKNKPLVIVDYAHTPDALEKVLVALRAHCEGKLYCLFGCGGDRDRGKRPLMAKMAEQYADHVMVTDDNPRTENPERIVADILEGFVNKNHIKVQHDRSKAIRDIIQCANARDCVLIAGKGAETYQQIGSEKIPFSDIEKVRENLL